MSEFNWRDCYVGYLNMDSRTDRLSHINDQLAKLGIPFFRTRGKLPSEFDRNDIRLQVQWNRTPGSIGCMFGQMEIMEKAYKEGKSAMVYEDDCELCSDVKMRLDYLQEFLNKKDTWDVAWLGGTVHLNPPHWHIGGANPDLPTTKLTVDAERTEDARIVKCYGAFCTYAYVVRYESIQLVLAMLRLVMHESMGIDWSFIRLGACLNTYMMLPGMVKQIDNMSNIGNGVTYFSGFLRLGGYVWQDKMEQFDPATFDWGKQDDKPLYFGVADYLTYYMNNFTGK
jgi:Glycosyltransferase family 25 (LPS biosynthesis protein)